MLLKLIPVFLIEFLPLSGGAGRQLWVRRTEQGARQGPAPMSRAPSYQLALRSTWLRRTYDFSPLWRSTVGFDRLFDLLDETQHRTEENYPPYNIERLGEDRYQISLALAGFSPDEIAVTAEQNVLTGEGCKSEKDPHA